MKQEKGFTLVELLAVIVILAIVLIIAVPGVLSIINKTKNDAYDRQLDMIKEAARNYIVAEHGDLVWEGTNPSVTVISLSRMQSSGYLDQKLLDPRDNSVIKHLAIRVEKNETGQLHYEIASTTTDEIGLPHLTDGMIPIVYDGSTWVKADARNQNFAWYDYDNHQWANMATVTESTRDAYKNATIGCEIKMEDILAMYVWIPRFQYKLFNVNGTVSPVGNPNMAGDYSIDVHFEGKEITKATGRQNGEWLTHPAFTFGGQELEGFWMAKFETGYADAVTVAEATKTERNVQKIRHKPNQYTWTYNTAYFIYQMALDMDSLGNIFGLSQENDAHMMKNIEWGALAYLTYSPYGKTGNWNYSRAAKEIMLNNNMHGVTGCGADNQNAEPTSTCHTYDTEKGQAASTTGNITGIYDTNGPVWNLVAGVTKGEDGLIAPSSGFTQEEWKRIQQENKYFDVYEAGSSGADRSRAIFGDATLETGPFDGYVNSWYGDFSDFVNSNGTYIWFLRGSIWNMSPTTKGGLTCSGTWPGVLTSQIGWRSTLI